MTRGFSSHGVDRVDRCTGQTGARSPKHTEVSIGRRLKSSHDYSIWRGGSNVGGLKKT